MSFPRDHVVEAGADPGIACPDDAIFCGPETTGLRTLVSLRPIRQGARVGGQEGACHPGALENAAAQQLRVAPSRALLQDVRQNPKILVAVGVAGARRKLEHPGGVYHSGGLYLPERRLGGRSLQHRHGPVVVQTRLVVAEVQGARRRLLQPRKPGAHIVIEHRRVGKRVQDQAAGELLGDRAQAKQRARREGKAPLGIGPAPGVTSQHLAVAQYRNRTPWSGVVAGQSFDSAVKAAGMRIHHGRHSRVFIRGGQLPSLQGGTQMRIALREAGPDRAIPAKRLIRFDFLAFLAVLAVPSEPLSAWYQGINREFSSESVFWACTRADKPLQSLRFLRKFPRQTNGEIFSGNREFGRGERGIVAADQGIGC